MRTNKEIIDILLEKRGITGKEDISEFLSDRPQKTYDPFLLPDMEAGVDLLLSEINSGRKICIYGDYDADGVTSVCILSAVFKALGADFFYYIPSRFSEGYGLNSGAVKKIYDKGADLLITVDCGSVSYDEVEYAKQLGMKVIVTDHHSVDERRADCILINPKRSDCIYPFKELAGCGVAFKLAQALQRSAGLDRNIINGVLDIAAIGTVGDIVSLKDENRTIVKYGLNRINQRNRTALKKLSDAISLKEINSENIAFGIAPHINAAGRMSHASEAAELFLTEDESIMDEQVDKLVSFNIERKKKQNEAYEECTEMISGEEDFILLKMEHIHEGIGGIAAGKVKEKYNRPVVIVTPAPEGFLKGTGRSIPGVDIFKLLKKHEYLFERFGGHKSACGFLMKEENLDSLKIAVNEEMLEIKKEKPDIFDNAISWDIEIEPGEITVELAKAVARFEPFGQDNPKPLFFMKDIKLKDVFFMGTEGTHARFKAVSENGDTAECVLFQRALELKENLVSDKIVSLTGSLSHQSFRGRDRVQFMVEELIG